MLRRSEWGWLQRLERANDEPTIYVRGLAPVLSRLQAKGLVRRAGAYSVVITEKGRARAAQEREQRSRHEAPSTGAAAATMSGPNEPSQLDDGSALIADPQGTDSTE